MSKIRLRGGTPEREPLYPLCDFPNDIVFAIGGLIVHRLAIGLSDITGDDFGNIWAKAVRGQHLQKPLGIADVELEGTAWSVKTVKAKEPANIKLVRLISGRNSPSYSQGIHDPTEDFQKTGDSVLNIWNARVQTAREQYEELRTIVLVRSMDTCVFNLFEYASVEYPPKNYRWISNKRGNLEAIELSSGKHAFTWQKHGSQFTILKEVPGSAYKFKIKPLSEIPKIQVSNVLRTIGFNQEWVKKLP